MYFLCITLKKRVFRFEFKFNWRLPYSGWCRVVNICLPTPRMEVKSGFSETSSWSLSESGLKSIENFRRILILVQVSQKGGWSAYILAYPWGEKLCLKKVIICPNDNLVDSSQFANIALQIILSLERRWTRTRRRQLIWNSIQGWHLLLTLITLLSLF